MRIADLVLMFTLAASTPDARAHFMHSQPNPPSEHPSQRPQEHPGPQDAPAARGIRINTTYYPSQLNDSVAQLAAAEACAIDAIVRDLDLQFPIKVDEYTAEGDFLKGKLIQKAAPLPIILLPDPDELGRLLQGRQPAPADGLFAIPLKPSTSTTAFAHAGYFKREPVPKNAPTVRVPRPQPVPLADFAASLPAQTSGRYVSSINRIKDELFSNPDASSSAPENRRYPKPLGIMFVFAFTDHLYSMELKDAREQTVIAASWCFPIGDANGRPRDQATDRASGRRPTVYTNLISTPLMGSRWSGQQVPLVGPHPYLQEFTRLPDESTAARNRWFGTEELLLPQHLIDLAHGIVALRKDATWAPLAPDLVLDAEAKNSTGLLALYISRTATDAQLVDALTSLAGRTISPAQRDHAIQAAARLRHPR